MKKNKKKLILITVLVSLFIISFLALMIYLNNSQNNYTFLEKKWIDSNSNDVIDVYIEKDLPIFSKDGVGVFYDLVEDLETDTALSLSSNDTTSSTMSLNIKKSLKKDDILIYKDHYILLSKNNVYINNIGGLGNKSVGTLNDDLSLISYNLTDYTNIEYKTYESLDGLKEAFENGNVDYIILPLYENLDLIIENSYSIIYHFDGLNKYYTASFNTDSKEFVSIVGKFFNKWNNKLNEQFNSYFTSLYYETKGYTEIEKESLINEDFIVGYINNIPLEGKINNIFSGLTGTYLNKFSELTGTTYKYIEYANLDKLKKAVNNKKVDIVYNAYNINNSNYISTGYIGNKNIVVLIPNKSDLVVNSIYDLTGKEVKMLKDRSIKNVYNGKNIFSIVEVDNINTLIKDKNDNTILIEKEVYDFYKTNKLKKYKIAYIDSEYVYDSFLLNNSNNPFNKLFSFYISTLSAKEISNEMVNKSLNDLNRNKLVTLILDNVFFLIIILLIVGYIVYRYTNKLKLSKKIKKEDKLLYLDIMTNLKNRNYLNDNIEYWEKNVIFPQAIIILDLNCIKILNDKQGHEAGDAQIKACANILIKTQRENSEIMRTNGNEFTIYLVGYEEKMIMSYIHKLNKELKNALPCKDYGVSVGYSMINDEIKTIDDAINEALIMVQENKEIANEKS